MPKGIMIIYANSGHKLFPVNNSGMDMIRILEDPCVYSSAGRDDVIPSIGPNVCNIHLDFIYFQYTFAVYFPSTPVLFKAE